MPNSPVAVITGSGRDRIGRVIAEALADQGYRIAVHYHASEQEAEETVKELQARGPGAEAFQADVGQQAQVDAMFDQIMKRFGRIDMLATTASIWPTKSLEDTTGDDVLRSFEVNTLGSFLCARRAGLIMANQPEGGSIILFGDWAIERPYADHSAYFIAKGAMPTLTRMLAVELAQRNRNIRVNCIQPGPVMFPPNMTQDEKQASIDSTLLQRANEPESIVQSINFFLSNQFVTGTCLPVDAGRSIWANE